MPSGRNSLAAPAGLVQGQALVGSAVCHMLACGTMQIMQVAEASACFNDSSSWSCSPHCCSC